MTSQLRLKGRSLLIGNTVIITLFLIVGIMLILCINLGVQFYEIYIRESLDAASGSIVSVLDFSVPLLLVFMSRFVWIQIRMGADRYFFRLAQAKEGDATDIFYCFIPSEALAVFVYRIKLFLIRVPFLLLTFAPSVICLFVLNSFSYSRVSYLVGLSLLVGTVAFTLNGIIFYRSFSALLFLSDYIFISGEYVSFRQILSVSVMIMKKERKNLLRLRQSFYGWFLSCIFIFPTGYVWSYYRQTLAVAAVKFLQG